MLEHRTPLLAAGCLMAVVAACSGGDDAASEEGASAQGAAGSGASTAGQSGAGGGGPGGASGKGGASGTSAAGSWGKGGGSAGSAGASGSAAGGASGSAGVSGSAGKGAGGAGAAGSAGKGAGGAAGGAGAAGSAGKAGSGGVDPGPLVGIVVTPPSATITVKDGMSTPVSLVAKPIYKSGAQGAAIPDATWKASAPDIASVDGAGKVTAGGKLGADVKVVAAWKGQTGEATVTVKVLVTEAAAGISPADQATLDGASAPDALTWYYPYDGTVFPRGLAAPRMMWTGGKAGDVMSARFTSDFVDIKAYFVADASQSYTLPLALWQKVTDSGKGGPVQVKVSRLSGGVAKVVASHTWRTASGALRGTVYYWSNNKGRILRIKPGAAAPEDFLASAGVPGCTTCHTVSANGNVLVLQNRPDGAPGDADQSVAVDLPNNKKQYAVLANQKSYALGALTANGDMLVQHGAFAAYVPQTGAVIPGTGLEGKVTYFPAFSGDDAVLGYSSTQFDVRAADFDPLKKKLTNERLLVAPKPAPYNFVGYFTASPEHTRLVYGRGTSTNSYDQSSGQQVATAVDLYLASTAGLQATDIALERLNGTSYPFAAGNRDRNMNYEPTFAPVAAGGYLWVVFTSRRTYGTVLTDPNPIKTKQLWVAAIDIDPAPGKDPSHPAFWLPGQELSDLNMRGFWALDPCRGNGETCGASSECCGGACLSGGVCGEPPGQTCKPVGGSCAKAADCCFADQGYQCINSHCTESKP